MGLEWIKNNYMKCQFDWTLYLVENGCIRPSPLKFSDNTPRDSCFESPIHMSPYSLALGEHLKRLRQESTAKHFTHPQHIPFVLNRIPQHSSNLEQVWCIVNICRLRLFLRSVVYRHCGHGKSFRPSDICCEICSP
jgi:hypothetical protein